MNTIIAEITTKKGTDIRVQKTPDNLWQVFDVSAGIVRHESIDPADIIRAMAHYAHYEKSTGQCFLIEASTGCSCCSHENFTAGPWRTREAAEASVTAHRAAKTLASQFSPTGRYEITEASYERLPDGRLVLDNEYLCDHDFLEPGEIEGQMYGFHG